MEFLPTAPDDRAAPPETSSPFSGDRAVRGEFFRFWYERFFPAAGDVRRLARKTYHFARDGFPAEELEDLRELFGYCGRFRILCLTNVYRTGTAEINDLFHHWVFEDTGRPRGEMPDSVSSKRRYGVPDEGSG